MKKLYALMALLILFSASMPVAAQITKIYYVTAQSGSDNNTGTNWYNAFGTLTKALEVAEDGDQIYLAVGTYKPGSHAGIEKDQPGAPDLTNRDFTFLITKNVEIYGGFTGTEAAPANRNPANFNKTILSGDLGTEGDASDNAYHVVLAVGQNGTPITPTLDGLLITGSNANGPGLVTVNGATAIHSQGGGMYNIFSEATIGNVTISGNIANLGGGMYNNSSTPKLTDVTISGNSAGFSGGGMSNFSSSPELTDVTISGNSADNEGGGMSNNNNSSPTLTRVTISGNSAGGEGGGMFNTFSSPTLTQVTISGNSAGSNGGGICSVNGSSKPSIKSSIIWGNKATSSGDNVTNKSGAAPTFSNSLIEGSGDPDFWTAASGNQNGGDNIALDPMFVAPIDPAGTGWTATAGGDYRLQSDSPALTAGDGVNMGAYPGAGITIYYVKKDATGTGSSWTNAFGNLTGALAAAKDGDRIYIAAGTYKPDSYTGLEKHPDHPDLTNCDRTFLITKNVHIYGGFDATNPEASPDDRKPENFSKTILSGDIDNTLGISAGDAYHVVLAVGQGTARISPTLDGLVITGGNADDDGSVTVNGTVVSRYAGGGMYNFYSNATLYNVTISGNSADYSGGGMNNSASIIELTNVTISGNKATGDGGGMQNYDANVTLTNVTISGNKADNGGGMLNEFTSPVIENSIIWGNKATNDGNNVLNYIFSTPTFSYSLIEGSMEDGRWNDSFGENKIGNIDADPKFVSWIDPSATGWTVTAEGDYRLQPNSPASGMGANEQLTPLYVKEGADGDNDGSSWEDAFTTLTDALAAAKDGDNIYLATGKYTPESHAGLTAIHPLTNRDFTFLITKNVHIYGGFAGNDMTENVANRNPENFTLTILSGDIDGVDGISANDAYHVVVAVGKSDTDRISPTLDGLVITGGNADESDVFVIVNGNPVYKRFGGGMYNRLSNATFTDVTISGNKAQFGGGIYNESSSLRVTNATISGNSADNDGGGIYNYYSSPTITNVTISGNNAVGDGGGMYNTFSNATLTNVTISGNSAIGANGGGGMYNYISSPVIENSIIWGNKASADGDNVLNYISSTPTFSYSLIEGSMEGGSWNPDFGTSVEENIDADPMFVNWIDPASAPTTDGDYSLYEGSPALGAGKDGVNMGAYQGLGEAKPEEPDPTVYVTVSFTVDAGFDLQPSATSVSIEQGGSYDFYLSRKEGTENEPLVTVNGATLETYYVEDQDQWYCSLNPVMGDTQVVITLGDIVDNDNPEDGLQVYSTVGGLVITTATPTPVTIYSITGSAVAQQLVEGQVTFPLPQGVYVIRTADQTIKAVVR